MPLPIAAKHFWFVRGCEQMSTRRALDVILGIQALAAGGVESVPGLKVPLARDVA